MVKTYCIRCLIQIMITTLIEYIVSAKHIRSHTCSILRQIITVPSSPYHLGLIYQVLGTCIGVGSELTIWISGLALTRRLEVRFAYD